MPHATDAKPGQEVFPVFADGTGADADSFGCFAAGHTEKEETENLVFTEGEAGQTDGVVFRQGGFSQQVETVFGIAFAAKVAYMPTGGPGADEKTSGDGFCRPGLVAGRPGFAVPGVSAARADQISRARRMA